LWGLGLLRRLSSGGWESIVVVVVVIVAVGVSGITTAGGWFNV